MSKIYSNLYIIGSAPGSALTVQNGTGIILNVDNTGVGIGTDSPTQKLHIVSGAGSGVLLNLNDAMFDVALSGSVGQLRFSYIGNEFMMNPYPNAFGTSFRFKSNPSGTSGENGIEHTVLGTIASNNGSIIGEALNIGSTGSYTGTILGKIIRKSGFLNTNAIFYPLIALDGNVGIGVSSPEAKLEVGTNAAYVFNGVDSVFKVTNTNGALINVLNGGGLELNNFQNNLGSDNSNQDFKSFFRHYSVMSPSNASSPSGNTYFHITNNLSWNGASYIRAGLNTLNTDQFTVFKVGLNLGGAAGSGTNTIIELEDNYGTYSISDASTYYKTGLKVILNDSFSNIGTGTAVSRGLYIDVTNADTNNAIETVGGNVIVGDSVGVGITIPTSKLHVQSDGSLGNSLFKVSNTNFSVDSINVTQGEITLHANTTTIRSSNGLGNPSLVIYAGGDSPQMAFDTNSFGQTLRLSGTNYPEFTSVSSGIMKFNGKVAFTDDSTQPSAKVHIIDASNGGTTRLLVDGNVSNSGVNNKTLHVRGNIDASTTDVLALIQHTNPPGGGGLAGSAIFRTTGGAGGNSSMFEINGWGFVTIGKTYSTKYKALSIYWDSTTYQTIGGIGNNDTYGAHIEHYYNTWGQASNKYGLRIDSTGSFNPQTTQKNYGLFVNVDSGTGSATNSIATVLMGGNVGMGIDTPTSLLHIKGVDNTSSNYTLKVENLEASSLFAVRNDGRVGIGTLSPSSALHVVGSITLNTGGTSKIYLDNSGSGKIFALTDTTDTDLFTIGLNVGSLTTISTNQAAFAFNKDIRFDKTGTMLLYCNNGGSGLTLNGSNNSTPDIFIKGTADATLGNVGINTNTPTARLHVKSTGTSSSSYSLKVDDASSNPQLYVRSDGNIGIGASGPSEKLEVNGSIRLSSTISVFKIGDYNALAITQGAGGANVILGHGNTMNDASNGGGIVIGSSATSTSDGIAIGLSSFIGIGTEDGIAIGRSATVNNSAIRGIAIGRDSLSSAGNAIAIGNYTMANNSDTIILGNNSSGTKPNIGIAISNPTARLHIQGIDVATNVNLRLEPVLSVTEDTTGNKISTTSSTPTVIQTITIPTDKGLLIKSHITVIKTGGAGVGVTGDVNAYIMTATYKNVSGVVTLIGTVQTTFIAEDNAIFDATFAINGTTVEIRGTGAESDNLNWTAVTKQYVTQ